MCDLVFEDPYFSITYLSKFDKSRNRVYLFVGNVPEHIETILKNFENPEIKKVPSQDLKILKDELLKENYKKTIEYWAELKKSKDLKMKFVFSRMMMDDSLNECKRKIFVHCSDMESDFYILPQNMELWVRDEKDTPHMLGYKYKDMIPHIDAPFELSSFEYTYNMYVDEPLYEEKAKGSRKRILESSDNYTLLYDLCKNIDLKNGMYNIYVSDAYDEYTHLLKTKKYERSDIIQKYLKNYFPVASYERKDIKSMYLLTKDEHQYNDFIVDNLFEYKVDMSQFESCYFNNFILNVNHYGIDDGGVEDALMYGGAGKGKKPIQIMKERNVSGMNSMLPNKKSIHQFLNKSGKSRSTGIEIIKEKNLSNENSMLPNKKSINQFLNKKKKPLNFRAHMEDEVEETDFIDLYQIFEYLRSRKIGKKTPFIKYNDYGFANPFILISKSAIDQNVVNKQLLLSQWTNPQMPVKKFNGLQLKRYIKNMEPSGTPLFSNLYLYKYGRIQLSIAFKSENKATFHEIHEAIMNCKDFIEDVNRNVIDYRISRSIDIEKKIIPPESSVHPKRGLELSKNCTIAYINYFIDYRGGDKIDLKDLFEFCKLFPSFFSIHPTKSLGLNSIKMRYRRVSGFADLDEVMERIERLKKSGAKDGLIIKVIEKEFGKSYEECKKYMVEYRNKYSRIESSSKDSMDKLGFAIQITKNTIHIQGVRNMRHMYDTYRFMRLFMSLYLHRDELKKNAVFKRMLFSRDLSKSEDVATLFEEFATVKEALTLEDLDLNIDITDQALLDTGAIDKVDLPREDEVDLSKGRDKSNSSNNASFKHITVGNRILAANEEISTDVQLTCDDAILELDTCEDFCNDAKYFIRRLQRHDRKLFYDKRERLKGKVKYEKYTKYSKSCQKIRQPVVLAYNPDDGIAKDSQLPIQRSAYSYAIKYGSDPDKPNWYICPEVWCPYCRIPIPMEDLDKSLIRKRKIAESAGVCMTGVCPNGEHQVFVRGDKDPFPGFQDHQTEEGLCLPCCFGKRQDDPKYGKYKTYQKCLGMDTNNGEFEESIVYVLGKSIPLERSRFGILPFRLERVLNSSIQTGYLGNQRGYLRRGIRHENHNSFLSAIANIFSCDQENPRSVDDLKHYIVDKIDEKLFRSLYGGNLINLFYDPHKNITPLQNYKNFILSKNIDIDHTYLWDLVQRPKIISEHGVNLFIFENDLLCPLGENVREFYDPSRKTILLAKHKQYYEPIYYVEGIGKQAQIQCVFENQVPEMAKLFEIAYDGCKSYHRLDWKSVVYNSLVANHISTKKEDIVIDYGLTLQETLKELLVQIKVKGALDKSFLPSVQYVDQSNKVFGIGLANKLFIPVAPSKLMVDLPNFEYLLIRDYKDISTHSLEKTIQLVELVQKSTKIPVKIMGTISDIQNKYVIGVMTEKGRTICVEKTPLQKSKKYKNVSQKFYSDIDIFIHDNISLVDDRIIFMNKRKFEDETYMRMRFELSRYLQDHKSDRIKLMEIIYDDDRDIQKKRNRLEKILLPIFAKIVKVKSSKEVGIDYNFYEIPNHRIPCGLRSVMDKSGSNSGTSRSTSNQAEIIFDCSEDPHCMSVGSECMLFVNEYNLIDTKKENLNIYIPMMMEELIRFTLKRNEIIKDHIPSIINRERVVENPNKYYIINTTDPLGIIQKVESIFLDKEGLYIDKRPLFDMISTHDVVLPQNKYTLTNMTKLLSNMNQMPEMWSKLLGNHFILIAPHHGSKTLFSNLDLLMRELKSRNNENNMEELNMRRLKEKMIEFMESPKNLQLFKKMEQKISATPSNPSGSKENENANLSGSKSQYHRDYILQMYKNMEPKVFRNVHDFTSLKHKILHEEYEGNDIDLFILSHIFKTNIIVLSKVKREFISYGNESTDYYTDFLLMLRNNNIDMFKYQWFQLKNKGFIHKEKDYPESFVREVLEKL